MKIAKLIAAAALTLASLTSVAQTTKTEVLADLNRTGGVYYAYPVTESLNTPAPEGYEPFYISHYGRHGSRYLISDSDYTRLLELMDKADKADALTPLGKSALERLRAVWVEAEGRGGDLSPLGQRQHHDIAARMYDAFPEVFEPGAEMTARSTVVLRCALSMAAFCEGLKEKAPYLFIPRESSNRWMNYLNWHSPESCEFTSERGPWREQYRKFEASHTRPDRMVDALFSDPTFVELNVNPHELMWQWYWVTVGMQDIETPVEFWDLWTPDELFDMWQSFNYRFYVCDSNYAGNNGMMLANSDPQLRNIIDTADEYIAQGKHGATLRFGHDGNLIPLAGRLGIEDCYNSVSDPAQFYTAFTDWKIAPMAGNIQMVFFKNADNDILVKVMLNEREVRIPEVSTDRWPFYRWDDLRRHYEAVLTD